LLGKYVMFHNYHAFANAEIEGFEDKYFWGKNPTEAIIANYRNLQKQDTDYVGKNIFKNDNNQPPDVPRRNGICRFLENILAVFPTKKEKKLLFKNKYYLLPNYFTSKSTTTFSVLGWLWQVRIYPCCISSSSRPQ